MFRRNMALVDSVFGKGDRPTDEKTAASASVADTEQDTVHDNSSAQRSDDAEAINQEEKVTENAQAGVQKAEAITLSWSRRSLILVFGLFWLQYFVYAFQNSITSNLTPYVTSEFSAHSLIPTTYIISSIASGALRLPIAKMLDLWGRAQGFYVMMLIGTLGLIMMAACQNVETFAAAQVFTSVGFAGGIYAVDITTSDISSLTNRGLAFAFTASPYIITAFAGPKASEGFYEKINFRWAFGTFSIIVPIVAAPLLIVLIVNERRARRKGLVPTQNSGRTFVQSISHYAVEFDVLGVFVFAAGFSLFLLPFSLADSAPNGWRTGYIIGMLVLGFVLIVAFVVIEKFVVPKPFLPFDILLSRTVLATCLMSATFQVGFYCWNSYFSSFLQVVHGLTISQAGYVSSTFDAISGAFCFVIGFLIRKTKHFKWIMLCAIPVDILAIGLMIYFRRPDLSVGYLVFTQVLIALSGAAIIITVQISVMSVVTHQQLAAALAVLGMFSYVGGAIGNTISGAIWTNTFPNALARNLPEIAQANLTDIYGSLDVQLSYAEGDPVRDAIILSYSESQRYMCIAGTVAASLSLIWVLFIKNIDVSKNKQVKGMVL